jgi:hypothetical protein
MVSLGEYFNGVQIVYIVDDLEPSDEIPILKARKK